MRSGRVREALPHLERASQAERDNVETQNNLGYAAVLLGREGDRAVEVAGVGRRLDADEREQRVVDELSEPHAAGHEQYANYIR